MAPTPTAAARERPVQPPAALRRSVHRRQAPATSLVLKSWLLLGGECGHARLLVVRREGGVEDRTLEAQALGERRLEGDVDARLRHRHDGLGLRRDLACCLERVVEQVRGGHHARHQAALTRLLRRHLVAREDELHCARLPHRASEALRAAQARDRAELDLWLAKLGRVRGENEIAGHRELAATAEREAVDGGDDRRPDGRQLVQLAEKTRLVHVHVRERLHGLDVGTGGEGLVA
mmetsp:Transcript_19369/g.61745  ORF Transcript_19369/g.61745 Transcript_19369/m.61745 type:complete len:235 (+) Transcript_19369:153-857(+)